MLSAVLMDISVCLTKLASIIGTAVFMVYYWKSNHIDHKGNKIGSLASPLYMLFNKYAYQ